MMAAPLRRVVDFKTETMWRDITAATGRVKRISFSMIYELLECGHLRKPKDNARLGGTDIGNAKKRRCDQCGESSSMSTPAGHRDTNQETE